MVYGHAMSGLVCCIWLVSLGGCATGSGNSTSGPHGLAENGGEAAAPDNIQHAVLPNAERVFTKQRREDWCWAACAEMALKYNGITDITQETLAERFKGDKADQTAQDWEIVRALATKPTGAPIPVGQIPTSLGLDLGSLFAAGLKAASFYCNPESAVDDLRAGEPEVVRLVNYDGWPGHVVFVTGFSFTEKRSGVENVPLLGEIYRGGETLLGGGRYTIASTTIYDPMKGVVVDIPWNQLKQHKPAFISARRAREVVEKAQQTLRIR